jgi:hypothetical protein
MLNKSKVETTSKGYFRHISDITSFSEARAYADTARDQPPAPVTPEIPKTLTFAELQALIEQGKTDEIPNNKHIPDAINVVYISYAILGENVIFTFTTRTTGDSSQSIDCPTAQKTLGGRIVIGMTSDAEGVALRSSQ